MNRFNFQSILFAFAVLFSLLIVGAGKNKDKALPFISIDNKESQIGSLQSAVLPNFQDLEKKAANRQTNLPSGRFPAILDFNENDAQQLPLPVPELEVRAALVEDLNGNLPFFELNIYQRWPLASLTKLMTAVIAFENLGVDKKITFDEKAIAAEGSAGNFAVGESFTVGDLIKSILVVSSNDAAAALANFYEEHNFINAMQSKAKKLGMTQTSFFDAAGLSFLNQSSVGDLKILVNYILENHPEIFKISQQSEIEITELNSQTKRKLVNINQFAGRGDFIGGKTGYTEDSNGNLISIFQHRGRRILIIVLGTGDRFGQTEILFEWLKKLN